jgi:hypothetical protein
MFAFGRSSCFLNFTGHLLNAAMDNWQKKARLISGRMQQVEVNLQNPGNMLRSNTIIFNQTITSPVFITKVRHSDLNFCASSEHGSILGS